jgi:hypothetical protein
VGVGGALLAAAAVLCPILGIVGGLLTITVIFYQHFFTGPVVIGFAASDWREADGRWVIDVPYTRHGRRSPTATIGKWEESESWVEVWAIAKVGKDNTVHLTLNSGEPFDCEVRIT